MTTSELKCDNCGKKFTVKVTAEQLKEVRCPKCNSKNVEIDDQNTCSSDSG